MGPLMCAFSGFLVGVLVGTLITIWIEDNS